MFSACIFAHIRNGHISVEKHVFWCSLVKNVKNMQLAWFLCINWVVRVFCACFLVLIKKWSYFSPKTCFLMHIGDQCQEHAICVVFLHKLTVWCVLCISPCTHTEWSYFCPKMCFLMLFGEQCQKHAVCAFFVHKLSDWYVLCISSCKHTKGS